MPQILLCEICSVPLPRDRCPVPRCPYGSAAPTVKRSWRPTAEVQHISYHVVMYRGMGTIERAGPFTDLTAARMSRDGFGTDGFGRHALVYGARPDGTVDVLD